MKILFFDTHNFDRQSFSKLNSSQQIDFLETHLNFETAKLTLGYDGVCVFVNDHLDRKTLQILANNHVKLVALRCAGFNNVDLEAAKQFNIKVVRVPSYSPHAVAEHALALLLTLNRKTHRAYNRVKELNFSLDGLVGFDLYQKKVGIIGMGKIGQIFAQILHAMGCEILAYDPNIEKLRNSSAAELNKKYRFVDLYKLLQESDIISLHVPLNSETKHLLNKATFAQTKKGVVIVNTGRGGLIDSQALIEALKTEQVSAAALDVYEEEETYFFEDFSGRIIQDDVLARLLTFPNVLITSHQGFLTREALHNIAETTLQNITDFENNKPLKNEVLSPA